MEWQLADAKNRFSEVVERALSEGPQLVRRRGSAAVMVVSVQEYEKLTGRRESFKMFLMSGPSFDGLDLRRDRSPARDVKL